MTVPGLGPFLVGEATRLGLQPSASLHDGRADVVRFARVGARPHTAEDVFVDLGTVTIARSASATADRVLAQVGRRRGLRPVVRMTNESRFQRRELRNALQARLRTPGAAELWVMQVGRERLLLGIRDSVTRRPRRVELPGSLRPAVAAAMLQLVDTGGTIIDPCCGSGTIVLEATRTAIAGDLAPAARAAARANGVATVLALDARQLPLRADSAAAVVTNLPFGQQHVVQGSPVAWYRRVLQEALRVAPQAVVVAAPTTPFRQALGRLDVNLVARHDLVLLGNKSTIWDIRRSAAAVRSAGSPSVVGDG